MVVTNPLVPSWLDENKDLNALDSKIWPASAARNERGELEFAGLSAPELVRQYGSPLHVIDEEDFEARLERVRGAFEKAAQNAGTSVKLYYASKALLTTEIARWVVNAGYAIDVSTGGELAVALASGSGGDRLGVHGNNKSLVEIGRAVSADVSAIVIDSEIEIERIASIAGAQDKIQPVRLRVNSGVHASTHEYLATAREDQKFGIALEDVPQMVEKIRSHSHLRFLGLHSHIGSQIFAVEGFVAAAEKLLDSHAELLNGGEVPELNLGGGFGISYTAADDPMPIEELAKQIVEAVRAKCDALGITIPRLAFEPGRIIAGPAGVTLYSVGTTKDVVVADSGSGSKRRYVSVDGGMSDNIRPALYGAEYSATLASRSSSSDGVLSRVVGKHCESGDIVVRHEMLPQDLAVNDLLAVPATGAYCFSLSSNYNFVPRPALVAVKDGKARALVRAESEQDLLERDLGYQPGGDE